MPRIYGYSAPGRNSVGVEYIIIEKATGVGMRKRGAVDACVEFCGD